MTQEEKFIARKLFQVEVYRSDGSGFQTLFVRVMQASSPTFRPVKPYGNQGDRKNDGFDDSTGAYYQVYAPESLENKIVEAVNKCQTDFDGLKAYWTPICPLQEFYFALNDKYKGVYPPIEKTLSEIEDKNPEIKCKPFLVKDLEDKFLLLPDAELINIIGIIPGVEKIEQVDYSALTEVVNHLIEHSKPYTLDGTFNLPDFDEKIKFNNLSDNVSALLHTASYQLSVLEDFFEMNSMFSRSELRNSFNKLYEEALTIIPEQENRSDLVFFYILEQASPKKNRYVYDAILVLMSYFFENCDIFEEPTA